MKKGQTPWTVGIQWAVLTLVEQCQPCRRECKPSTTGAQWGVVSQSGQRFSAGEQSSRKKLQLLRLLFNYFYVYEHLACMYVCVPPTCLSALAMDQKKEKGFAIPLSLPGETLGSFTWRCPRQTVHIHSVLCPLRPHSLLLSLAPHTKPSWTFY